MGSMSYSVAIKLPAGFAGASPSLSLDYNSSAGSGPVGIGWSMPTMAIGRMTSRGAPDYDTEDLFDVGGSELVQVGSDGGDLIYRARFEKNFVRYRWVGVTSGAEGYWIAENPDGSRSYFGADADGNIVASARRSKTAGGTAEYCLVETRDPYGHSVRYTYQSLTGTVPLLTGIRWLDDGAGTDIYSVAIGYERRPDLLSDASRGYDERIEDRVGFVRVLRGTSPIREYVLTYEDDAAAGGFSRLAQVEQFGLGGAAAGERYPVVHSFAYSQALGVECQGADCDRPYIVPIQNPPAGATGFGTGEATFVDINGDGLPDVLDTGDSTAHQIYLNTLTADAAGNYSYGFSPASASALARNGAFKLGIGSSVQIFDVNGDGRSDIFNPTNGAWLENDGRGDWAAQNTLADVSAFQNLTLADARFIDIDDDKRVDLLTSTSNRTTVYHNDGDRFSVDTTVDPLGVQIGGTGAVVQFADMNGDGFNDPVVLRTSGSVVSVTYKLNLGHGRWSSTWKSVSGLEIGASDLQRAEFEDLNGDNVADVVIVNQGQVDYAINRNGDRFDPFVTITSNDVNLSIPGRDQGETILFVDMNANGSQDVVWITTGGDMTYLELFPRRPNLLTRVDNGIGSVQE
ncbi:MAG: SpvB/TcaC N-terminal domain-containing protein, partial [Myxococcota bacterium]